MEPGGSGRSPFGSQTVPPTLTDTLRALSPEVKNCCMDYRAAAGSYRPHWELPDPPGVGGTEAARLDAFRRTRDELRPRLEVVFGADVRELRG
jgi:hypothetical protein